ncbi:hypothetical protein HRbin04_00120 [archaeon HR04]|nr:hypothetical protein HRbin04_00120 [archaeon HR04]
MLSYNTRWFDEFIGLGYSLRHVYPCILLLFDNKKRLKEAWDKIIKLWPDDEIKIRFVEIGVKIEEGDYDIREEEEAKTDRVDEGRDYKNDEVHSIGNKEKGKKYAFIMYCRSRILQNTWVFLKLLDISDNYRRLKAEYDGKLYVDLALCITKGGSYELEIFKYRKSVSDVAFLYIDILDKVEEGVDRKSGEGYVNSDIKNRVGNEDKQPARDYNYYNSSGYDDDKYYDANIIREAMKILRSYL